jgi:hypothetical protein
MDLRQSLAMAAAATTGGGGDFKPFNAGFVPCGSDSRKQIAPLLCIKHLRSPGFKIPPVSGPESP